MKFLACGKGRWICSLLLLVALETISFSALAVPRFVYTANYFGSSLSIYQVDGETGMLLHREHVPTVKSPSAVILHPSGKFLYAVSQVTDKIAIYRVNAKTGALTETADSQVLAGVRSTFQLEISSDGKFLYVPGRFTGNLVVHRINSDTGALTHLKDNDSSTLGERARFVEATPDGRYIYVSNTVSDTVAAFQMAAETESVSAIEGMPFPAGDAPQAAMVHPSGKFLYVANWRTADISAYAINADTGHLSPIPGSKVETGVFPFNGSVHPSGNYLYVANWASGDISVFLIDQKTGVLSPMLGSPVALANGSAPVTVSLDASGHHAYVPDYNNMDITVFDVHQESGQLINSRRLYSRPGVRALVVLEGEQPVKVSAQWMITADKKNKTLNSYSVDSASGQLHMRDQLSLDDVPGKIALHSDAGLIFVSGQKNRRIDVFVIDKNGKINKQADSSKMLDEGMPVGLRVNARGSHLYVITQAPNQYLAYAIDVEKGQLTGDERLTLPADSKPVQVAAGPAERLTFVLDGSGNRIFAYRYMRADGPVMFELNRHGSPFAMDKGLADMAVDPTGRYGLVVSHEAASVISYAMPSRWGPLKKIEGGALLVGKDPVAVSIHPNGRDVFVLDAGKPQIHLLQLDSESGALQVGSPAIPLAAVPAALTVDPSGRFAYLRYASRAGLTRFEIDVAHGRLTHPTELLNETVPSALAFTAITE